MVHFLLPTTLRIAASALRQGGRIVLCLLWLWAGTLGTLSAQAADASPTHTIRRGETLSQIAERYGVTQAELMELNGIDDPDAIYAGQILVLPLPPEETPATVAVDTTLAPAAPPTEHVVRPGESLSQIAAAYGLDQAELMAINGIADADTLVIGQRLRLTPVVTTEAAREEGPVTVPLTTTNPIATLNRTYAVLPGDTPTAIALRFGVDEDALVAVNRLDPTVSLEPGQELVLPATAQDFAIPSPLPPTQDDATTAAVYVVKPGDSLGRIAQDNGVTLAELLEANQIDNPDTVYVGQELRLPTAEPVPAAEEAAPAAPIPHQIGRPRSGFYYYTVKPGDTLSTLAREFDSTQLAILEYNNLPDAETVYLGLELRIPYGPPPLPVELPPVPLSGTRFLVSLSRQQCWLLTGDEVRYAWTCSTGYGAWITRTGTFAIQSKLEMAKSTAYELDMPYWLGIYDVGAYENGIHGLPVRWEDGQKIWEGLVGQPATFGCAMLNDADAATLFDLAFLGMPVHIVP